MSITTLLRATTLGLTCLVALAGCSTAPDRPVTTVSISKLIFNRGGAPESPDPQKISDDIAKALSATDAPLILLNLPQRNVVTVMQNLEQNRGYHTYGTADRRSITLRGGMVTATRGLGNDIMSSDSDAILALVSARQGGSASRVMRYLDGEELTLSEISTCTIRIGGAGHVQLGKINTPATTVTEDCQSDRGAFTNIYQVAPDGRIVQSRQWHSPLNEYLFIQTLR